MILFRADELAFLSAAGSEAVCTTHAAAAYTVPEAVKNAGVPLHKGALRYYQEIGVEIPAELIDE